MPNSSKATIALACVASASLLCALLYFNASPSGGVEHPGGRSLFAFRNKVCNIFGCFELLDDDSSEQAQNIADDVTSNTFDTSNIGDASLVRPNTGGVSLGMPIRASAVPNSVNSADVSDGLDGCVFHLDAKEMYRFTIGKEGKVQEWAGPDGQRLEVPDFPGNRPSYLESNFQGMHSLGFKNDRRVTVVFAESRVLEVFVVYAPGTTANAELLVKDGASTIALMAAAGTAPAIAIGTATAGLSNIDKLIIGADFQGRVAEILVFDRILSDEDRQVLYDRLMLKWIARKPRELPNMFTKYSLGLSESDVEDAVKSVALNLQQNYYKTTDNFRGSEMIYNFETDSDGRAFSRFHPEWFSAVFYAGDKAKFDSAIDLLDTWHMRNDGSGKRYFYAKVGAGRMNGEDKTNDMYFTAYSGQGNYGFLGEVLLRGYAKYRDPRYLELANEIVGFWYLHTDANDTTIDQSYFYKENDSVQGTGEGIVKMFKNDVLDSETYTECTYQSPTTARMATEFGAEATNTTFLDLVPNAQNRWFQRGAHPVTGLVPSTFTLDGRPVGHRDEKWKRFCNDVTEKAWDRFLNVMLNYEQDYDAGIAEMFRKVATWANSIGVDAMFGDYELDGTRDLSEEYKQVRASEGMRASIASLSTIVHNEIDMKSWVADVWENKDNTDRSLRGYARAFFVLAGAVQIPNDAPTLNLVSNGGFESQLATTGWSRRSLSNTNQCTVTDKAARRGSRGLACEGESLYPLLDTFMLSAGATYSFSAWVRSPARTAQYYVSYQAGVIDGPDITKQSSSMSIGDSWERIEVDFTHPSESVTFVQIEVMRGDGELFHLDDAQILLTSMPIKGDDVQLMGRRSVRGRKV